MKVSNRYESIKKYHDEIRDIFVLGGMIALATIVVFLMICFIDTGIKFYEGYKQWELKQEENTEDEKINRARAAKLNELFDKK